MPGNVSRFDNHEIFSTLTPPQYFRHQNERSAHDPKPHSVSPPAPSIFAFKIVYGAGHRPRFVVLSC